MGQATNSVSRPAVEGSRLILATDELDFETILRLGRELGDRLYAVKIHSHLDRYGPVAITQLLNNGYLRVWADVKLHDIPNTVALRAKEIFAHGAEIITVHASGGVEMMKRAVDARALPDRQMIYAVTLLTSIPESMAKSMFGIYPQRIAFHWSEFAAEAGVQGVVCSPTEVANIAENAKLSRIELITPGIRSAGVAADDQARIATPGVALLSGASRLVVGRQITKSPDPIAAIEAIEKEIAEALTPREAVEEAREETKEAEAAIA